ncbi:MAG: hypothetical protein ACOZCO_02360 [Bacteroidota bacterium]
MNKKALLSPMIKKYGSWILITITLFFSISVFIGCTEKTKSSVSERPKRKFPVVMDTIRHELSFMEADRKIVANYNPLYFGKETDTIYIKHGIHSGIMPSELLSLDKPSRVEQPTGEALLYCSVPEYRNYFSHWLFCEKYKHRDSVDLSLAVDTTQIIANIFDGFNPDTLYCIASYPVFLKNVSSDTVIIGYGEHIPIILEAKDESGNWNLIEEQYVYMCGVGLNSIILPPNEIVITSVRKFEGDFKTELRLKLGKHYSNPFFGTINKNQFYYTE